MFRRRNKKTATERAEPPIAAAESPVVVAGGPEVALSDILAKLESLEAALEAREDPAAVAARLEASWDRLAALLETSKASHPELGLEAVLESSGLERGKHYDVAEGGYTLKLPGNVRSRIATVPLGTPARDMESLAADVRGMLGDADILFFPDYALAELLSAYPDMISEAAKSSTTLCTPPTMLTVLGWVRAGWENEKRIGKMAGIAAEMAKAVKAFAARYAELGLRMAEAREAYNASIDHWAGVEDTVGQAVQTSKPAKPKKVPTGK